LCEEKLISRGENGILGSGRMLIKKSRGMNFSLDKRPELVTLLKCRGKKQTKPINGGIRTMAKKKATKKTAAKKATKKMAAKPAKKATTKKAATKRKPNPAFMKALTPSAALAAVIGSSPMPRTEVVKKVWAYIKKNNLQDAKNRRNVNADDKLKAVFGKNTVSMFEMSKILAKNLK
jgi:chromatin remodeling complex protein RSC6